MNVKKFRALAETHKNKLTLYAVLRRAGVRYRKEVYWFGLDGVKSRKAKAEYLAGHPTALHYFDVQIPAFNN